MSRGQEPDERRPARPGAAPIGAARIGAARIGAARIGAARIGAALTQRRVIDHGTVFSAGCPGR